MTLHLHAVPEQNRVTMRCHSWKAGLEIVTRLMLMHLPFEYGYDGHSHTITTLHRSEACALLGSPTFENAGRIIVEEG
jgi:hypothetical protein